MGRILLVDDDQDFSTALARRLVQEGYAVSAVGDTVSALHHFDRQEPIDLVIADLHLCRESALNLCSELRRRNRQLPLILLSAAPDAPSYLAALRLGAYEYLGKPVDFAELRDVMKRALNPLGRTA